MEVHHHSHTARKSLKHYSFEFFMLFFAVFCGFLAEYFLEYRIERHREHEFVESMVRDLKEDTAQIRKLYDQNILQSKQLDTLFGFLIEPTLPTDSLRKVYRLYLYSALNYRNVVFADRTISQLKNSGGLRLIRNQQVSDSIMNYDAGVKGCDQQFDVVKESWKTQSDLSYNLFDLGYYFKLVNKQGGDSTFRLMDAAIDTRKHYANHLIIFSGTVQNYAQNIQRQKEMGSRLIAFLKKEYDLD